MKVTSVRRITLSEPVPVFDLTVDEHHNFKLADGCYVHNSKDVADALAGVVTGLSTSRFVWAQHGIPIAEEFRQSVKMGEGGETYLSAEVGE